MAAPLMPKATAVWLIDNTKLAFQQIAEFCHLHLLEVQAIADGEAAIGMVGYNPIDSGQLTLAEIQRCERDPNASLILTPPVTPESLLGKKGRRYTPVAKRQDKPDAIAWILKYYPNVTEAQICRLLSTTRSLIKSVRQRTHWNTVNIKPRNPVQLGLCSQVDLDQMLQEIPIKTAEDLHVS
jgi:uncharacterized protein